MTGPTTENYMLYVQPETFDRLIVQDRVGVYHAEGQLRMTFRSDNPRFPNVWINVSKEVTPNAVHRRRWVEAEKRHIFEFVGDV